MNIFLKRSDHAQCSLKYFESAYLKVHVLFLSVDHCEMELIKTVLINDVNLPCKQASL